MVQTPIQRTILWVVFGMSLLLLWDKYLSHTGQPSLFGAPSQSAKPAPGTGAKTAGEGPGKAGDASVPSAASGSTAASNGGTTPGAASAALPGADSAAADKGGKAELLEIKNDVLSLQIDTVGGQVRRSDLLQHTDTDNPALKVSLLQDKPGALFQAQTGWVGTGQGGAFPNHRSAFTVVEKTESSVKLAAESGGLKVLRTLTIKPVSTC